MNNRKWESRGFFENYEDADIARTALCERKDHGRGNNNKHRVKIQKRECFPFTHPMKGGRCRKHRFELRVGTRPVLKIQDIQEQSA